MNEFSETSRLALAQAPALLARWLPGGKQQGQEYLSTNPTRNDRRPGSFKVNTATGLWGEFATGEAGGDLISLRAYLDGISQGEALRLVADEVGATPPPKTPRPQPEQLPMLPIPDNPPKAQPHPRLGKPDQSWCYRNEKGERLFYVCRFQLEGGGKAIMPLTYWPDGWRWKALPAPRPLYGLDRLAAKPEAPVLVVEGEKAAEAAQRLFPELVAVTSPGGSKAAGKADWGPLKGRGITIWPDHDQPGSDYAQEVARLAIEAGASTVRAVELPPEIPPAWDLADNLPEGWGREKLKTLMGQATPWEASIKEAPLPLMRPLPKAEAYPAEALGPILAPAAQDLASIVRAPLGLCCQSVLASAALAVQGHADVEIDGRVYPTSQYFVTVADSGERKTAVDNVVIAPHLTHEKRLAEKYRVDYADYLMAMEAWVEEKKQISKKTKGSYEDRVRQLQALHEPTPPLAPITICGEPTTEGLTKLFDKGQPSLGLFTDEGGRFIGGHAMSQENMLKTAAALSSIWGAGPIDRVRSGDGASKLYGRRLSMHVMVQPGVARALLGNQILEDQGLLSRLLFCWPNSTAGSRLYKESDPNHAAGVRALHRCLEAILDCPFPVETDKRNELTPHRLSLEPQAKVLWIRFHDEVELALAEGQDLASIRYFASKSAEHAARLAGVLQLVEDLGSQSINPENMALGIRLAQFYIGEMLRLHQSGAMDPDLVLAQKVLDWLKGWGPLVSVPDLYQKGPGQVRDVKVAKKIAKLLEDNHWLEPIGPAQVKGTQRQKVWRVAEVQS